MVSVTIFVVKKKNNMEQEERPMQVQIRTGYYVTVTGLYAKHVPKGYEGAQTIFFSSNS